MKTKGEHLMKIKNMWIISMILLLISGCSVAAGDINNSQLNDKERVMPVYIELDQSVITDQSIPLQLSIKNNTANEYTYGVMFELYRYDGAKWELVAMREEMAFIMIALILQPHGSNTESIDLSFYYNTLDPGLYRIEKRLISDDGDLVAFGEFEVK